MQLKEKDYYRAGNPPLFSIAEAVEHVVNDDYDSRGTVETLEIKVENLTKLVGALVELLKDKAVVDASFIYELLPDFKAAFPVKE